jgi:hypothetical protein
MVLALQITLKTRMFLPVFGDFLAYSTDLGGFCQALPLLSRTQIKHMA